MTEILAPCAGTTVAIADVPDPVFSGEIVGPGIAIDPAPGPATVVAPIAGMVLKVHPHAFVVLGSGGVGVLVHLGIDTVKLKGEGFEVLAEERSTVQSGDPMVRWDPDTVTAAGYSALVIVVAMDRPAGSLELTGAAEVASGVRLFSVG